MNGKAYELPRIDQTLILVLPNLGVFVVGFVASLPHPCESVPDRQRNIKSPRKKSPPGEYAGMKGVWKDTIFVEGDPNGEDPELGAEIEYRTR